MAGTFEQTAIVTKDPYAWLSESPIEADPSDYPEFENPLEVVVRALNQMIFPSPKKIKFPEEPTGRKSWMPGIDPESRVIPETIVPGILEGNPLQRVMQYTPSGDPTEGEATFINFICDCSGSMSRPDMGLMPNGDQCERWEMARIICSNILEVAQVEEHYFQVIGYDTAAWDIWEGPSNDYDAALDYILRFNADESRENGADAPFYPRGGTAAGTGMQKALENMEKFVVAGKWKVKNCYTFVISDEDLNFGDASNKSNRTVGYWDEKLRAYGPVFYAFTTQVLPDGSVNGKVSGQMVRAIDKLKRELDNHYAGRYKVSDCSTSFGLFYDPIAKKVVGGGTFIEVCQGRSNVACEGAFSDK